MTRFSLSDEKEVADENEGSVELFIDLCVRRVRE